MISIFNNIRTAITKGNMRVGFDTNLRRVQVSTFITNSPATQHILKYKLDEVVRHGN